MFEAALLVITMAFGPNILEDTHGPYHTETACKARIAEMQAFVSQEMRPFGLVKMYGRCDLSDDLSA